MVIDEDGWAYWSAPLAAGEATNLLLSDINLKVEVEDEWYYGIHVKAQMATAGDWRYDQNANAGFYDGKEDPSKDGEELLNLITGSEKVIAPPTVNPDASVIVTKDLPDPIANMMYFEEIIATGALASTFTLQSGILPDGMVISPNGLVAGIPANLNQAGDTFTFTVRAENTAGFYDQTFSFILQEGS